MSRGKVVKVKFTVDKIRNLYAVDAHFRRAGDHGDKRKDASKKACRKGGWNND